MVAGRGGGAYEAMTDLKQAIRDHFGDDYTLFFEYFHPQLKPRDGKAKVLCSTHEDHNPSMNVVLKGNKAGSYYCPVCDQGGHAIDYYAIQKNLSCKTEFPQVLRGIVDDFGIDVAMNGQAKPKIVATFDYTDESGTLAYQTVRKEPGQNGRSKDFVIRRPDEGGWIWNAKNLELIPYRLDQLAKTKGQGSIVIVEGEAKADALWAMGIRATTNPFGAGKWRDRYSQYVEGEDVILWPDNDAAGVQHCEKVGVSVSVKAESVRWVSPPEGLGEKGDVLDGITKLRWDKDDIEEILTSAKTWHPPKSTTSNQESGDDEDKVKESQASILVKLVCSDAELFHDQYHTPHALVNVGDHYEVLRCTSKAFRRWIVRQSYEVEDRVPSSEAVSGALNMLEAFAAYDGDRYELQNRVADHEGAYWLDLTDERCRAIRTTASGWEIDDNPPVLFNRYDHQAPHPNPVRGGDINRLFDFVPISDPDARLLLLTWVVSSLVPGIPHPIPVIHGPQGAGKSSACRFLRHLIDPSSLGTLRLPRDQNELTQSLAHNYIALFDNIDVLYPWQSDALCRACTGEGFSKRQLFTDDDDIIYSFRRCVGLNGINIGATRADLLDRSILIELERITTQKRLEEEELESAFSEARPHILGGILDALSKAIQIRPTVKLKSKPRMADFARWGCAIAMALGFDATDFQRAYRANIREQNSEVLESHPVAAAVVCMMGEVNEWEGRPAQLLEHLVKVAEAEKIDIKAKVWPKAAHILSRRLREVKPNLEAVGVTVETGHHIGDHRAILLRTESSVSSVKASAVLEINDLRPDATLDATDATENSAKVASACKSLQDNEFYATDATDATFRTVQADAMETEERLEVVL